MAASFLSGDVVKMLKDQIETVSGYKLMFGGSNPTVFALDAEKGSVYISDSSGKMYLKQDDGSSTNWEELALTGEVATNLATAVATLTDKIEISKGTRLVSASIATITDGGLTVTSPAYKVHIVDHATNTLTVAEKTTPTVFTPPDYTTPIWYAYITAANTVQWEPNEISVPANRTLVPIFSAITNGTAIVALNNGTRGSYRDFNGFIQDFSLAYPPKSIDGNVITLTDFPNAAGALLNKTAGLIFASGSNVVGSSSGSEGAYQCPSFLPYASITNDMQGAGGVGFVTFQSARLSGARYDVNGVLTNTGVNNWTIRAIYVGQGGLVVSPLGQTRYTSLVNARNALGAESNNVNPNLIGLMLAGWALCRGNNQEFAFVANASNYGAGSTSVSLNLWTVRTLTSADSPFAVTGSKTIYVCDSSAGNIEIILPTIDSSIASDENRFVKSADANSVKVSVNGGVQTIGGKTAQYIWEKNTAFSVVAADTLTYLITQDSRKVDTFETPVGVWAKTSSIEHWDLTASTLGTGATFTGNNHGATLTTGTTASTIYSKEVSTEELIADQNYFAFVTSVSDAGVFDLIVEGWNGSAWAPIGGLVEPFAAGDALSGLAPFFKTGYTKRRAVLSNSGTTAGLTCTIARGEWTDDYFKSVQYNGDSETITYTGYTSKSSDWVLFASKDTDRSSKTEKIVSVDIASLFTKYVFNEDADYVTSTSFGYVAQSTDAYLKLEHYNSSAVLVKTAYNQNYSIEYVTSAAMVGRGKKGDYIVVRTSYAAANTQLTNFSITATPIGTSKGIIAAAEVDLSQYRGTYQNISSYVTTSVGTIASKNIFAEYFQTNEGSHFIRLNGFIGMTAGISAMNILIDGITYYFPSAYQLAPITSTNNVTLSFSTAATGTNRIEVGFASGVGSFIFNGILQVASRPTWATQPTIKPATVIAPVAVQVDTDLTPYTPVISGFGAVTNVDFQWRRNGDMLEIYGKFTSGVSTAVEAQVGLPSGLTIDTIKAPTVRLVGTATISSPSSTQFKMLATGGDTYLNISRQDSAEVGLIPKNGNSLLGSGGVISFFASVPIEGWSGHFEASFIATNKSEIHKHATYLSSNETEAGFCEFTGKKIYKRGIYFPAAITSTQDVGSLGLNMQIVNPAGMWTGAGPYTIVAGTTDLGSSGSYGWLRYYPSTGVLNVVVSGPFGFPAGSRFEIKYVKP